MAKSRAELEQWLEDGPRELLRTSPEDLDRIAEDMRASARGRPAPLRAAAERLAAHAEGVAVEIRAARESAR